MSKIKGITTVKDTSALKLAREIDNHNFKKKKEWAILIFGWTGGIIVTVTVVMVLLNASSPTREGWVVELVKVIGPGIVGFFFGNQSKK